MKKRILAWTTAVCLLFAVGTSKPATSMIGQKAAHHFADGFAFAEEEIPTATEVPKPTEKPIATEKPVETEKPAPTEAPAATQTPSVTESPRPTEKPAATEEPSATEVPTATQTPVPTGTPVPTQTPAATEKPAAVPLKVRLNTNARYAFADEDTIALKASVSGGAAPYRLSVKVNDSEIKSADLQKEGSISINYAPTEFGVHTFQLTVSDADGMKSSASVEVPVAVAEEETEREWKKSFRNVELTGDWRADLLAIAQTQIGYDESSRNFIIDDEGRKRGYTRYGDWYGSAHAEWCAIFISFCLHYAGIPEHHFPYEASCAKWKKQLTALNVYEDDEDQYEPQPGDLIFFNSQEDYKKTGRLLEKPHHVGIVSGVSENHVETIEGNLYGDVRREKHKRSSIEIVGYCNTGKLYELVHPAINLTQAESTVGVTLTDEVNMRSIPSTFGEKAAQIENIGTPLRITGQTQSADALWYAVEHEGISGFIRSDLIALWTRTKHPANAPFKPGDSSVKFRFFVPNAVRYVWQRAEIGKNGESVWTDIDFGEELVLDAVVENMRYVYRCVAADEEKNETVSRNVTMVEEKYVEWIHSGGVTDEMIARALNQYE